MNRVLAGLGAAGFQVWQLFLGHDRNISARKLAGTWFIIHGGILLSMAAQEPAPAVLDVWVVAYAYFPGAFMILVGSWFWKWLSEQNLKAMAEGFKK